MKSCSLKQEFTEKKRLKARDGRAIGGDRETLGREKGLTALEPRDWENGKAGKKKVRSTGRAST